PPFSRSQSQLMGDWGTELPSSSKIDAGATWAGAVSAKATTVTNTAKEHKPTFRHLQLVRKLITLLLRNWVSEIVAVEASRSGFRISCGQLMFELHHRALRFRARVPERPR